MSSILRMQSIYRYGKRRKCRQNSNLYSERSRKESVSMDSITSAEMDHLRYAYLVWGVRQFPGFPWLRTE